LVRYKTNQLEMTPNKNKNGTVKVNNLIGS